MADKVIFLTSGSTWTVPSDWNSAANSIEAIGGGAGGGDAPAAEYAGGGAAYSKISNVSLTIGANVSYAVGAAGLHGNPPTAGGDSWFGSTSTLLAKGSPKAATSDPSPGATAAACVGSIKYGGGSGSYAGGAAGGPNGAGGSAISGNTAGGNAAQASEINGGIGGSVSAPRGGDGKVWTSTSGAQAGPGGGGGSPSSGDGGAGGNYGAGGGIPGGSGQFGGNGAPGIIVITYTPITVTAKPRSYALIIT